MAQRTHTGLVAAQLAAHRVAGRRRPTPLDELTVVVKTFERPRTVRRFVASARRLHPGLRIVVVDDSREPQEVPGAELLALPFDSGLSAGRNAGLKRVATPYVLIADDDLVLYRGTRLREALALLASERRIDIMGGRLIDLPFRRRLPKEWQFDAIFPPGREPVHARGERLAGLRVVNKVPNFFLAHTDRLRLVPWDDEL